MCVIRDKSHPNHVSFRHEESGAAPVCCGVDWNDYFFIHPVLNNIRNPRFAACFPPREGVRRQLRRRREVQEVRAATNRRFNSPLAFLRRRANELGLWVEQESKEDDNLVAPEADRDATA